MSRYIARIAMGLGALFSLPMSREPNLDKQLRQHPEDLIYCGHLRVLDINDSTGYDTQTAEAFLRSDGDLVRLLGCHILRLEHRKQMSGVQHEFIRLEMGANGLSEDRQYRRFIYVSRGISQEKRKARNSLKASSDRSSVVLSFDKTPLDTIDVFKLDDIDEDSLSWTLCTLDFSPYLTSPESATSSGGPTIIDVLCLAQTISEIAPQYKFYKYSCYWFARTFYDVFFLKFFLAHKREDDKNFHLRGEWHGRRAVTDYGQLLLPPSTDRESRTAKQEDMLEGTTSNLTMTQNSPATDIPLASKPFIVKKAVKPDQDPAKQVAAEFDKRFKDALKDLQNPEINSHCRRVCEEHELKNRTETAERMRLEEERMRLEEKRMRVVAERDRDAVLQDRDAVLQDRDAVLQENQRLRDLLAQA